MAATLIRQTIKEESPVILQAATEAASGPAAGVASGVGIAVRRAAGGAEGVVARESSVLTSHLSTVRQSATHLSSPGTTTTLLDGTVHAVAPQPSLMTTTTTTATTTTGGINPALLTSSIAHEALSTTSRRATRNGTTLTAQLDLNVTRTTSTIREAVSNAVQEGMEEQLDKAMDMYRLVTMPAGGVGPTVAGAAV